MALETVSEKGLVLLGCGKMGSAMLQGWLAVFYFACYISLT